MGDLGGCCFKSIINSPLVIKQNHSFGFLVLATAPSRFGEGAQAQGGVVSFLFQKRLKENGKR
ncbi:hypothetical protein HMPREF9501_01981 [Enterococcus faecalis TX0027]|nr:hypothetical protein HMPREF9501_01981 [Enterococcus faecalis TX0027]RTK58989.1 hypothetical protein DRJ74_13705 [Enterococcus faecalis]